MHPITFSCTATLRLSAEEVAGRILDLSQWPKFEGYGLLPGIGSAEYEVRTPHVVGSRIRVVNRDGSCHVEDILEWQPPRRLRLRLHGFSPPLSRWASGFDETWEFAAVAGGTSVVRTFALHPASSLARPLLWMISFLFRCAVARHLRQLGSEA